MSLMYSEGGVKINISRKIAVISLILLLIISLGLTTAAAEQAADTSATEAEPLKQFFNDISASANNVLYINYLADLKIISGYPDGSFKPQEGLNRAQAAVVLVKAAGLDTTAINRNSFADVAANHWAAASIAAAAQAGYLKGYPDGSYHPEEKLTRAQGIALVMRLSKQKERDELPALKDMPKTHWAAPDIATALNAGMIGLSEDKTKVHPEAIMTRGSLARALGTLLTRDPGLYTNTLTGTIKDITGEIKLTRNGTTTTLQNDAPVYQGDTITAAAGNTASISYPDGSSVLIKENTELKIKESLGRAYIKKDGSSGLAVDNVDLEIKRGTIFGALAAKQEKTTQEKQQAQAGETLLASRDGLSYIAENAKTPPWYQQAETKKVKMKVDMPYGVAAIRGTYILVSVNQDGSCNVSCLTGDVEVGNKTGASVPLAGGKSSGVSQTGNLDPQVPLTDKDKQEFSSVQQWVVNTALQIDVNKEATAPPLVEMMLEIPDQPLTPIQQAEQVKNTIEVVLNALESSGIELTEQVKNDLKQQLEKIQLDLNQQTQDFLQNPTPPATPDINQLLTSGGASEEPSVSYINYATAGTYGPESAASVQTVAKNIIVSAAGVSLQNMIISKDLTLGAGIGEGSVTLNNVKVLGSISILGGADIILENCQLNTVKVNKSQVRVMAQCSSTIEQMNIAAAGTILDLASGTGVNSLQVNAQAYIIGTGQIGVAEITASGVEIQQVPLSWTIATGIEARIGGKFLAGSGSGNNAKLSSLSLTGISLNPSFVPETLNYTASVANIVYEITLSAIPQESTATVSVNGISKTDNTHLLNLNMVGANPINIIVSSQDGTNLGYNLIINRAGSSVCEISCVSSPAGASISGSNITASVSNSTDSLSVDISVSPDATWKLYSDSGYNTEIANKQLTLAVGDNLSYIKVTAQDGSTTGSYTLTITRAPSSACNITAINTPAGASISGSNITASVSNSTDSLSVDISVSPDATWKLYSDSAYNTEIANKQLTLAVGDNLSYIKVTAHDGSTTGSYTMTVRRLNNDAAVATAASHYTVDNTGNTIQADQTVINTNVTVESFLANLTKQAQASWKVVAEGTTIGDQTQFDAAVPKNTSAPMSLGDMLAVKAEDGTVKVYAVTVILGDPVVITQTPGSIPEAPSGWKKSTPDSNFNICYGMLWGNYTYWCYDDISNNSNLKIIAYDSSNTAVKTWDKAGTIRYIQGITFDSSNVTFIGQSGTTLTLSRTELMVP